jgi:hypothetical protein
MDYTEEQIREQLRRGPDEYDIFRVKVKGDGATKWLNVPQPAIVALANAVGAADDAPRHPAEIARDASLAVSALMDRTPLTAIGRTDEALALRAHLNAALNAAEALMQRVR